MTGTRKVKLDRDLAMALLHAITDKPWDDSKILHARLSIALGQPIEYVSHIRQTWWMLHLDADVRAMLRKHFFKEGESDDLQDA